MRFLWILPRLPTQCRWTDPKGIRVGRGTRIVLNRGNSVRFYLKLSAMLLIAAVMAILCDQARAWQHLQRISARPPATDSIAAQSELNAARAQCWLAGFL
jgi:hypothetical protein